MKRVWWVVALAACGASQAQRIPADPPAGMVAQGSPVGPPAVARAPAPAPATPPQLDDAAVIAQSHAWFEATDRADAAALDVVGPRYVLFDFRFYDRAILETQLKNRRDKGLPPRTRVWEDERVFGGPGIAVFVGHSITTTPATAERPAVVQDGYNTLVWNHDGTRWVIAMQQWARGGKGADQDYWNTAYQTGGGFNTKPNALLVETLKGKKPGRALDLSMGQGRNAIYAASQGWTTTGVDISDEGIRQAKAEAARRKLQLEALLVDTDVYDLGKNKWDLITMIYAGADAAMVERIKPALKKGGLFITEYFHAESDMAKAGAGGWKAGELAALFATGYEILRDDTVEDNADWAGMRKTKLVRFVARKK